MSTSPGMRYFPRPSTLIAAAGTAAAPGSLIAAMRPSEIKTVRGRATRPFTTSTTATFSIAIVGGDVRSVEFSARQRGDAGHAAIAKTVASKRVPRAMRRRISRFREEEKKSVRNWRSFSRRGVARQHKGLLPVSSLQFVGSDLEFVTVGVEEINGMRNFVVLKFEPNAAFLQFFLGMEKVFSIRPESQVKHPSSVA